MVLWVNQAQGAVFTRGLSCGPWWPRPQSPKGTARLHTRITGIAGGGRRLSAKSSAGPSTGALSCGLSLGLASPGTAAGFHKGTCQEQVFQETQPETSRLLATETRKSGCVTSPTTGQTQVSEPAQVQGEWTTQRREYWEARLIRRSSLKASSTYPHPTVNYRLF